ARAHGNGDDQEQHRERPRGVEHGESGDQSEWPGGGSDGRRAKTTVKKQTGEDLAQAAGDARRKIQAKEARAANDFFNTPSEHENDQAIQQQLNQSGMQKLKGDQLPDKAVL